MIEAPLRARVRRQARETVLSAVPARVDTGPARGDELCTDATLTFESQKRNRIPASMLCVP